ncbi:MAG: methyltransferase [Phycisphaerae bacterium]
MKRCLACERCFAADDWRCPACGRTPLIRDGFAVFAPELADVNDGFEARYFDDLEALEAGHFWFRARNRLILAMLHRFFPSCRQFFEIGCGTGFVLRGVRDASPAIELSGSDIFCDAIAVARRRLPDARLMQIDARRIPFDAEFDVIGAFDVLEHIAEDEDVLHQMHRAVRPGGGVLITVPQHQFLWSVVDDYSFHKRRYSRRELFDKLRRAGFRVLRMTSFVSSLLPLMWLSRRRQPRDVGAFDPRAELRIGRATNALLETVMTVERGVILSGVSLPAGGSLLAVAQREDGA